MNQAPSQFLRPVAIIKILEGNKKTGKVWEFYCLLFGKKLHDSIFV